MMDYFSAVDTVAGSISERLHCPKDTLANLIGRDEMFGFGQRMSDATLQGNSQ